jgi:hypothetical protein
MADLYCADLAKMGLRFSEFAFLYYFLTSVAHREICTWFRRGKWKSWQFESTPKAKIKPTLCRLLQAVAGLQAPVPWRWRAVLPTAPAAHVDQLLLEFESWSRQVCNCMVRGQPLVWVTHITEMEDNEERPSFRESGRLQVCLISLVHIHLLGGSRSQLPFEPASNPVMSPCCTCAPG